MRECVSLPKNLSIMEKIYGATERTDGIQQTGRRRWEVFYGFGEDEGGKYCYRQTFDHRPAVNELHQLIIDTINADTDEKILKGFVWQGIRVWLSQENQNNFKAAYDLAVQSEGATLPVKFKLGEDASGAAIYHTFEGMADFTNFYTHAVSYINQCLNDGWQEKDNLDMEPYR